MATPRVFLIGGAPGAGKTTLGCALAARIGASSVTIDDLVSVARTVTTPQTHPGLSLWQGMTYQEYFTSTTLEQLQADADRQHEAAWPFVHSLIIRHYDPTTTPIVIDGWHLRPERVVELDTDLVDASWIHISPRVLEERERRNVKFLQGAEEPERMFQNFLSRSLWYNEMIRGQAAALGMRILQQTGETSSAQMCDRILSTQASAG